MWCKCKEWATKHATGRYGQLWLSVLSVSEAIFLPVPTDTFMMGMLLIGENRKRWVYFATITMASSVLGAVIGYFLAFFLFNTFGPSFIELSGAGVQFKKVQEFLDHGIFIFTFIGAVSPIPYKLFVLTAGFIKANFFIFLIASIIGRSVRLYLSAWLVYKYGEQGITIMKRYAVQITIVSVALLIVYVLGYMFL